MALVADTGGGGEEEEKGKDGREEGRGSAGGRRKKTGLAGKGVRREWRAALGHGGRGEEEDRYRQVLVDVRTLQQASLHACLYGEGTLYPSEFSPPPSSSFSSSSQALEATAVSSFPPLVSSSSLPDSFSSSSSSSASLTETNDPAPKTPPLPSSPPPQSGFLFSSPPSYSPPDELPSFLKLHSVRYSSVLQIPFEAFRLFLQLFFDYFGQCHSLYQQHRHEDLQTNNLPTSDTRLGGEARSERQQHAPSARTHAGARPDSEGSFLSSSSSFPRALYLGEVVTIKGLASMEKTRKTDHERETGGKGEREKEAKDEGLHGESEGASRTETDKSHAESAEEDGERKRPKKEESGREEGEEKEEGSAGGVGGDFVKGETGKERDVLRKEEKEERKTEDSQRKNEGIQADDTPEGGREGGVFVSFLSLIAIHDGVRTLRLQWGEQVGSLFSLCSLRLPSLPGTLTYGAFLFSLFHRIVGLEDPSQTNLSSLPILLSRSRRASRSLSLSLSRFFSRWLKASPEPLQFV